MSSWITLIVLFVTVGLSAAVLLLPRLKSSSRLASASLDFTGDRRRVPQLRRPPPSRRRGGHLSFRD